MSSNSQPAARAADEVLPSERCIGLQEEPPPDLLKLQTDMLTVPVVTTNRAKGLIEASARPRKWLKDFIADEEDTDRLIRKGVKKGFRGQRDVDYEDAIHESWLTVLETSESETEHDEEIKNTQSTQTHTVRHPHKEDDTPGSGANHITGQPNLLAHCTPPERQGMQKSHDERSGRRSPPLLMHVLHSPP